MIEYSKQETVICCYGFEITATVVFINPEHHIKAAKLQEMGIKVPFGACIREVESPDFENTVRVIVRADDCTTGIYDVRNNTIFRVIFEGYHDDDAEEELPHHTLDTYLRAVKFFRGRTLPHDF